MSGNRSVQSAQRRRAGPPEPSAPGRSGGPQPSINTAQMFASQARGGAGPNLPPGRLAAQQLKQQEQGLSQQGLSQDMSGIGSINKMTIAQAITLITLRLGSLETRMLNLDNSSPHMDGVSDFSENGIIHSIMERLDILETERSTSPSTTSSTALNTDIQLLKQQVDTVKQTVIQSKGISTTLVNENKILKSQIESLKAELKDTRDLLVTLQNISLENNKKLLELSINTQDSVYLEEVVNEELEDSEIPNEIIETDLKTLIENEMNGSA